MSNVPTPDEIFPINKPIEKPSEPAETQGQVNALIEIEVFTALRAGQLRFEVTEGEHGSVKRQMHTVAHKAVIDKLRGAGFKVTVHTSRSMTWGYTVSKR